MVTRSCDVRSMALRPRLSTGLPLSKIFDKVQTKQAWLTTRPAKQTTTFYSSAAWRSWLRLRAALDPWLCVPAFRRVCLYRLLTKQIIAIDYVFTLFISAKRAYRFATMGWCGQSEVYVGTGIARTNNRPQFQLPYARMHVWNVTWRLPEYTRSNISPVESISPPLILRNRLQALFGCRA